MNTPLLPLFMIIDSARLYVPVIAISVILAFFHYIAILAFYPLAIIAVLFVLVLRSLKDDGRYAKYAPFLVFIDLLMLIAIGFWESLSFLIYADALLLIIMIIMHLVVKNEIFHFERTILSMNNSDRTLARTALKSGKYEDFAKVAAYTDWSSLD